MLWENATLSLLYRMLTNVVKCLKGLDNINNHIMIFGFLRPLCTPCIGYTVYFPKSVWLSIHSNACLLFPEGKVSQCRLTQITIRYR